MFQEEANQFLRLGEIEETTLEGLPEYPKLLTFSSCFWRWELYKLNIFLKARQKLTPRDSLCIILYYLSRPSRPFFAWL